MTKLANIVSKSAPLLGTVIGGPIGAGVGSIIGGIASLFGGDTENTDDLAELISKDPNASLKLREFELQHIVALQTIASNRISSAQNREIEITKATGRRDWLMIAIALIVVLGFFAMCLVVAFTHMDKTDHDIFYMLLGTVGSGFTCILNYFFGSSIQQSQIPRGNS